MATNGGPSAGHEWVQVIHTLTHETTSSAFDRWRGPTIRWSTPGTQLLLPSADEYADAPLAVIVLARSDIEMSPIVEAIRSSRLAGVELVAVVTWASPDGSVDPANVRHALASSVELHRWLDGPHPRPAPAPSQVSRHDAPASSPRATDGDTWWPAEPITPGARPVPPGNVSPADPRAVERSPTANRTLDLVDGRMLYTAPEHMRTGEIEQVEVRVAQGDIVDEVLRHGLRGRNPERIESIPTSTSMTVEVTSSSPESLRVVSLSPPTQLVHEHLLATWEFDLHAERRGRHLVRLSVRCEVDVAGEAVVYSPPVIERHVEVEIAPGHSLTRWWREHWKWAVATTITVSGVAATWWALVS